MTEFNMIATGIVGSKAYGTDNVDSDTDIMGVYLEDRKYVTGIFASDRGTSQRTYAVGARATADDTDGAFYPLRHFVRLASDGNPNITPWFYLPAYDVPNAGNIDAFDSLHNLRDTMLSKKMGRNCLGYMLSQRDGMMGAKKTHTNRPELIEKYGYDTKYAYHMIRVGLMGLDLMMNGTLLLPLAEADVLREIRDGKLTKDGVLEWSHEIESELRKEIENSDLPDEPDYDTINATLHEIYLEEWRT